MGRTAQAMCAWLPLAAVALRTAMHRNGWMAMVDETQRTAPDRSQQSTMCAANLQATSVFDRRMLA
ncbi:hypothetical protein XocBAI15_17465 [Xanthomonas oryzae pv. oryzicola]|nr:hypothetical protein XocBAI15_17465 [Xanthomonas oryzae pv. oryzicola]